MFFLTYSPLGEACVARGDLNRGGLNWGRLRSTGDLNWDSMVTPENAHRSVFGETKEDEAEDTGEVNVEVAEQGEIGVGVGDWNIGFNLEIWKVQ